MKAAGLIRKLQARADPQHAEQVQRYFKTAKGQYGEGDKFLGLRMPQIRKLAEESLALPLTENSRLLQNRWHEARMLALLILTRQYALADARDKQAIYRHYLAHSYSVNNWDLVDCSAHLIVGPHLSGKSHKPLIRLAGSAILWERRIAVMSTLHFIRQHEFSTTLLLTEKLLGDSEDLIHKACGWMLRETGRRDRQLLTGFLDRHVLQMPRTMLRYAIEHLPASQRKRYLARR